MKAVILAGGLGTRLSEETTTKPKPMVEIGGKPIIWHIMKIYAAYGICDFVVCLGYKGYVIKEYFANYFMHMSDVRFDLGTNRMDVLHKGSDEWRVTLIDTGEQTLTGGRLKRIASYLDDEPFCMTYGDGVGSIDISASIAFHRKQGKLATLTAVRPPGRFGAIEIDGTKVRRFMEKPSGDGGLINGGFFVLEPGVIDYIDNDQTSWERQPLENLAKDQELNAFVHQGFWQPMDTLRDKRQLQELWESGAAPWKIW